MNLYHIYIGTQYQGPSRGNDAEHAILRFAKRAGKSVSIYQAKPARTVQQLKEPKPKAS